MVYVERMTQALSCYHKASNHAARANQKAYIAGNLAVTQFKCGKRLYENYAISVRTLPKNSYQDARLLIDYYLKESMTEFERA